MTVNCTRLSVNFGS